MTVFEDKLKAAKEAKDNNVNTFVWKLAKNDGVQEEVKMMDATPEQLQYFYDHCWTMLYNTADKEHPGRYILLDIIKEQRNKCNAELYLRFLEKGDELENRPRYPRINYLQDLRAALNLEENRVNVPKSVWSQVPIYALTNGIPEEFRDIPLTTVMDGCLDTLGKFDKTHLTLNFLLKLGIWFTQSELRSLTEKDTSGKPVDRLEQARKYLDLKDASKLRTNPKGLSLSEMKSMVKLRSKKYSDLTTDQLTILRNKVLFRFEDEVQFHIDQWEERIRQIKKVAQTRGIELKYNA